MVANLMNHLIYYPSEESENGSLDLLPRVEDVLVLVDGDQVVGGHRHQPNVRRLALQHGVVDGLGFFLSLCRTLLLDGVSPLGTDDPCLLVNLQTK